MEFPIEQRALSIALSSAPEWARKFIEAFRARKASGQSTRNLRPRDFASRGVTVREVRSIDAPAAFVDVRAADGSSLTKVPQWVRQVVAAQTASLRAGVPLRGERRTRTVVVGDSSARRRQQLLAANA